MHDLVECSEFALNENSAAFRILTAQGRGAVAVIQIMTSQAGSVLDRYFACRSSIAPASAPFGRILYGTWNGEDVVVVHVSGSIWEIHCHGGIAAVRSVADSLNLAGFSDQTYPPSGNSLATESSAVTLHDEIDGVLLQTRTRRTASLVLAQAHSSLLMTALQDLLADTDHQSRRKRLRDLLRWSDLATHLTRPWSVLVLGPPNAGKSSLVNALAGKERTIVCDVPGTTRDLVDAECVIDDWPFVFTDSAGIRSDSEDLIEQLGMHKSVAAFDACDACLFVEDAPHQSAVSGDHRIKHLHTRAEQLGKPVARVLNKCDLLPSPQTKTKSVPVHGVLKDHSGSFAAKVFSSPLCVSAKTHEGLPQLISWLTSTLMPCLPDLLTPLPLPGRILTLLQRIENQLENPKTPPRCLDELACLLRVN
jgi:tRNA modification GTPase